MTRLPVDQEIPPEFYGRDYFIGATKSAYADYGPGEWVGWLVEMIVENLAPTSVLDVGCAYGLLVERFQIQHHIPAYGFDISPYAMQRKVTDHVWQGSASDPASYRTSVDLLIATEMVEHLTESQAKAFLSLASLHSRRMLLLGIFGEDTGEDQDDHSHIHIAPVGWWVSEASRFGWVSRSASAFNEDEHSRAMAWAGRFLLFTRDGTPL